MALASVLGAVAPACVDTVDVAEGQWDARDRHDPERYAGVLEDLEQEDAEHAGSR